MSDFNKGVWAGGLISVLFFVLAVGLVIGLETGNELIHCEDLGLVLDMETTDSGRYCDVKFKEVWMPFDSYLNYVKGDGK